ncbi:three-Cys-motif partner protein TcmP [Thiothrix winogradskyi]|uniref:Three-Cys-motif partner protein TcmP n=1 Tax=Thiothrix winogradskyi TaxID=96472 RepID=A0ABY3T1K3_9GAMM|nr:three-Cys-motif partner protein TcmP [Thiothrix winogradskyi]UJS24860.1 three-Cys-motif partner protein TcmP [Thiothrix winogradskyi]
MADHYFGGAWTEIKLEILKKYLDFYTQALKNKPYELLYIDAFAGSGNRSEKIPDAPLLGEDEQKLVYDGSARIALDIERKFDRYLFIEASKERCNALGVLKKEYPSQHIKIENSDANQVLQNICSNKKTWQSQKYRGVLFLDPYGNSVEWKTLEAIASTRSLDVWFLFPISGMNRQLNHEFEKIEDYKEKNLNKILGTDSWKTELYKREQAQDLFGSTEKVSRVSMADMEKWVKQRLENCFPCVSKPLPLPHDRKPQQFSLFFCISNPDPKAIGLALKVANHILKSQQ